MIDGKKIIYIIDSLFYTMKAYSLRHCVLLAKVN